MNEYMFEYNIRMFFFCAVINAAKVINVNLAIRPATNFRKLTENSNFAMTA